MRGRTILSLCIVFLIASFSFPPPSFSTEPPTCVEVYSLPYRINDKVKATYSIVCSGKVSSIVVQAYLTRTKGNGTVVFGNPNINTCEVKDRCSVTATIAYVYSPSDLYHTWGKGTVTYYKPPTQRTIDFAPYTRSPLCADCNGSNCGWV